MKDEIETPNDGRVTEWLRPAGACGPTGFGTKCRSNAQWCREEVNRLEAKGIHARIVHDESGMIAVFTGKDGE